MPDPQAADASTILTYQGKTPIVPDTAFIAPGAWVIGDVTLDEEVSIWFGCVLRGDDNAIRIGRRTNVQDGTVIHVTEVHHPTIIGARVTIGHGARLHGCNLEDDCLIGIGSVVLDGAVVESRAIVAAGAVVPPGKRVPAGQLWTGNPARYLRDVRPRNRPSSPPTPTITGGWSVTTGNL